MHRTQSFILKSLQFKTRASFSELNIYNITSDRFNFHLKRLVTNKFISKDDLKYSLTSKGKEFINRAEKQAKIGVAIHCIRTKNGKKEYLIHRRGKEPFKNWYGSISGKVLFGENPIKTSERVLKKETGLDGDFTLKGIAHYIRLDKEKTSLEDEYFWVYKVDNIKGGFRKKTKYGENIWLNKQQIKKLKNIFASFDEMKEFNNSNTLVYVDRIKTVINY
ncbi:hypothetical protein A2130_02635 [Candidatus Woesebacteria bacterium GWC2_33_12]|uniref:NUDIX hydrolase n=1 Tax=Candidatus Woesebacteria bacterium GW2011_GWB1_33_22 TaxID=1618566 RepID=A0A0G0CLC6_9BACT|nr:MAG: NUDIX hydrolase [Candidatus Woesebacteria bacterium GW2011_GWC2_33_12]KKP41712.1 MAG: NUDIX hydrolase [Candidatus Woesebacteria bacterium GW2011_GWA2_33_20]KKP44152.1 MAG: NUDIX hydrolase [Candidatus Woesebacteria bacterium GW2011_GWB1_33_22]KKP45811.1 MAG: NUDIX hydrolase [Microgenomates group bacterium GW2011_GWC1_33_28]KKP50233.1 MAG: NUDIX hydrolase [Candidatus Woesebacteria bacterium GW2011_GWA1_33_33]OGM07332.1 MAG: hypothetical protein A2130_02635 [Candidatus Woesebacteria bacte